MIINQAFCIFPIFSIFTTFFLSTKDPVFAGLDLCVISLMKDRVFMWVTADIDESLDLEKFSKRNDSDFSLSLARS